MINKQRKYIYPEYEHIQLLKACILEGDAAIQAWQNWDRVTDINDIDNASMRLLPSLYLTLKNNNIQPEYFNKIKGVYRRTIVKNKILLESLNNVLIKFKESNIEVILLKGGALILQNYYSDPFQRPMSDIDLLINPNDTKIAKQLLTDMGWTNLYEYNNYIHPLLCRFNYFKKPNMEIDLHSYLLYENPDTNIDSELWKTSRKIEFKSHKINVLNPTYLFMHVCLHGAIWSGSYPLRWIVDAMLIINSKTQINWQDIVHQAKTRRLTVLMHSSLKIIDNIFDISVPKNIMQQLENSGSTLEQIWYYFEKRKPMPLIGSFIRNYFRYKLFYTHKFSFPGWLKYMQYIYSADSLITLPWTLLKKLFYKLINYFRK